MQLYTGNFLTGQAPNDVGKGGKSYYVRSAVCLRDAGLPGLTEQDELPHDNAQTRAVVYVHDRLQVLAEVSCSAALKALSCGRRGIGSSGAPGERCPSLADYVRGRRPPGRRIMLMLPTL